jgi:hypothetical protein
MESTLIIADTVIIRIYVRTPNKAEILVMHESSYHLLKIWKAFLHMVDSCGRHLVHRWLNMVQRRGASQLLPPFLNSCRFGQHIKTKNELRRDVLTTSFPKRREYITSCQKESRLGTNIRASKIPKTAFMLFSRGYTQNPHSSFAKQLLYQRIPIPS